MDWAHSGLGVKDLRLVLSAGGDALHRVRGLHCLLALWVGEARARAVKPEFSLLSWAAMLFAAGIGIDLMFFSVAEPVTQYMQPPEGAGQTMEAARRAMVWTLFHYGLTGWSMYALMGMALGYFSYRYNLPLPSAPRCTRFSAKDQRSDWPASTLRR